ncbi:unnamed protein product [Cylindrotheca closterium]|uniref:Uncharacterized protein n=1 Tax=Cylindrotheca closterium TaxID=2856 RepID=A0AAD2PWY8_9STRA|nr:unnamed protein product [Cylindrotheca closterium]
MKHPTTSHKRKTLYKLLNMGSMQQQHQHRGMKHYEYQVFGGGSRRIGEEYEEEETSQFHHSSSSPSSPASFDRHSHIHSHTHSHIHTTHTTHSNSYNTSTKTPELSSTPKMISQIGGLGVFEFIASYFSRCILEDPHLHEVYGGISKEQAFLLHVGLLLFCVNDNFIQCLSDNYEEDEEALLMIARARENPGLQEQVRLGLMNEPMYFNRVFHHLMEALSVCLCRKSVLLLLSRLAMVRNILQVLHRDQMNYNLATIREHEILSERSESSSSSSSTWSFAYQRSKGATNE